MESVFIFFCLVIMLGFLGALFIRYRTSLQKWIKDPKYGSAWYPKRETILKRKIEDANAELVWLAEKEQAEKKD